MKKILVLFVCVSLLILFCLGCNSSKLILGKVEGTVTLDGQPLKMGNIIFVTKGTRDASGIIENGVIKNVMTFVEGDGAPVGHSAVAIIAIDETPNNQPQEPPITETAETSTPSPTDASPVTLGGQKFSIPPNYTNPETSGLTVTIQKGINTVKFELTSKSNDVP
jgi:hypothetical protein